MIVFVKHVGDPSLQRCGSNVDVSVFRLVELSVPLDIAEKEIFCALGGEIEVIQEVHKESISNA
jgi:hypothetical protein